MAKVVKDPVTRHMQLWLLSSINVTNTLLGAPYQGMAFGCSCGIVINVCNNCLGPRSCILVLELGRATLDFDALMDHT